MTDIEEKVELAREIRQLADQLSSKLSYANKVGIRCEVDHFNEETLGGSMINLFHIRFYDTHIMQRLKEEK